MADGWWRGLNNTQRDHIWRTTTVQPAPRRPLTAAQIVALEQELKQQNEDRQKGKHRLKEVAREARAVPLRAKQPQPVLCHTCDDLQVVFRIRGGRNFGQPCPDCNGGTW